MQQLKIFNLMSITTAILFVLYPSLLIGMQAARKKTNISIFNIGSSKIQNKPYSESVEYPPNDRHNALARIKKLNERAKKIQSAASSLGTIKQQIACYKEICILYNRFKFRNDRKETFLRLYRAIDARKKIETQNNTAAAQ